MKILFLTSRAPYPPIGGDRLRAFHFIKALSRQHRVTLLSFVSSPQEARALQPISAYVEHYDTVLLERRHSYFNCVLGLFSHKPLQVHYYRSAAMRRALHHHLQKSRFDLVFVHLMRMADYLQELDGLPKIMDLTDALSLSYERSAAFQRVHPLSAYTLAQRVERRRVRTYEAEVISRFDCNLLISPVDRDYLSQFVATEKMQIIGPGVSLQDFEYYGGPYDRDCLIFFGKMSTFPNQDAALYFHEQIFPLVLQRFPQMQLHLVGIEPGPAVLALRRHVNVKVTGYVPDIRPYLHRAVVSVCPMRTGAGAKNKVLESLAVGTPVVATPLGIEGIEVRPGREVLTAETSSEFAAHIARLVENPALRQALARRGRQLVEQSYSWELVQSRLHQLISSFNGR